MNRSVAGVLAAARKQRAMTQAHLADAAGISERTVRRAEQTGVVSAENLRALCAVLEISIPAPTPDAEKDEHFPVIAGIAGVLLLLGLTATWALSWYDGGLKSVVQGITLSLAGFVLMTLGMGGMALVKKINGVRKQVVAITSAVILVLGMLLTFTSLGHILGS
jgi:transcriptional regulator with XRE-family HTH domain